MGSRGGFFFVYFLNVLQSMILLVNVTVVNDFSTILRSFLVPKMTFLEIREMLDTEEKMRQDGKNLPDWPQFG